MPVSVVARKPRSLLSHFTTYTGNPIISAVANAKAIAMANLMDAGATLSVAN